MFRPVFFINQIKFIFLYSPSLYYDNVCDSVGSGFTIWFEGGYLLENNSATATRFNENPEPPTVYLYLLQFTRATSVHLSNSLLFSPSFEDRVSVNQSARRYASSSFCENPNREITERKSVFWNVYNPAHPITREMNPTQNMNRQRKHLWNLSQEYQLQYLKAKEESIRLVFGHFPYFPPHFIKWSCWRQKQS